MLLFQHSLELLRGHAQHQIGSDDAAAALKNLSALTINAVLSYQACDDRICFTPPSVPLSWTVDLRALDRERGQR